MTGGEPSGASTSGPARPEPPRRLGELSRRERGLLLALVLGGACLRIVYQWGRPFTGDEIGTLLFLEQDYGVLFSEFRSWLTMNVYLAGLKALASVGGSSPWLLVAPSLLAGVAVVPVVAALTLRLSSARHALVAAALSAYNPFLVHYSVQIRSYMLLSLFALLALLAFLDWQRAPRWRTGWKVALAGAAAFLLHANGVYPLVALGVLLVLWRRLWRPSSWTREEVRALASLALPAGIALGLALLAYVPLLDDMAAFRREWSHTPPTSTTYLPGLFEDWFGGGYGSLATLALLSAGLWCASQVNRALAGLAVLAGVPLVLVSLLGVSHFPWAYSRFLVPVLPLVIVLVAFACVQPRSRFAVAALACVPLAAWAPGHARHFGKKQDYPWTALAEHLSAEVGAQDRILAVDHMIRHELSGPGRAYEARFTSAAELLEPGARAGELRRLLVLCESPALVTGAPQRSFGLLQLVEYRGRDAAALASSLSEDLARTVAGRIESDLSGHYKLLHELLVGLGRQAEAQATFIRFLKCQSLLHRERLRPVQMP